MRKLNQLIGLCKCGLYIYVNLHRDEFNETVDQYFKSNPLLEEEMADIEPGVYEKMKELDTIICLHFYPDTPIGSYKIYHYDLESAVDIALGTM